MKKIKSLLIILILSMFLIIPANVYARAGGGGGGGSSSGGGSSAHGSSGSSDSYISDFTQIVIFTIVTTSSFIIFRIKIIKYHYYTMKDFKNTDWNYKELVKRCEKTYFILQKAWTDNNIKLAKDYLSNDLYENYKAKLEWMEIANKRNILKKIKLLNIFPISLVDMKGNINDKVYMYIKGKMIDYTIDTKTNEIIDGSQKSYIFIEYWLFVKNKNGNWLLKKIYQEDELDIIPTKN